MKKLGLSIISICFAIVTLVSSTFAWFSLNKTVYVDGLELNVTGGENILLSIDGIHWYQNLTADKIKMAAVAQYKGYTFNEEEQLVYEDGDVVPTTVIDELFNEKITLAPLTSVDGKTFTDFYGTTIAPNIGKYLSFDLYFTCESDAISEDTDIFFYNGINKTLPDGNVVYQTKISSKGILVPLKNRLETYNKSTGVRVTYQAKTESGNRNTIYVNPANALRFSTHDVGNDINKIYELDAFDLNTGIQGAGLGSYATNYTGYSVDTNGKYMAAYDSSKNAAFTYFNNLKSKDIEPLEYENIPETVKEFSSLDKARVCSLKAVFGYEAKVRFNFWLEGWDADCFDGIGNTKTSVNLTFTTKSEVDYDPIHVKFYTNLGDETPFAEYANANPGTYLVPALAPNVPGKYFKGWAVVQKDGTVARETYDQTVTLKSLITSYYDSLTEELELVALF